MSPSKNKNYAASVMSTFIFFSLGEYRASINWRNYIGLAKIQTLGICILVNFDNNVPMFTHNNVPMFTHFRP